MAQSSGDRTIELRVFRSRVKIPVIFLLPLMLLATLYCTLYFYLNSNWLLQRLPNWLHAGFGGDFAVAELVVDPSLTTVHLYGAKISRAGADQTIIDAPEVHASLDPLHLLNRRVVLDRGLVRRADVRLAFDEEGDLNLLDALGIDPPDEPQEDDRKPWLSFAFQNLQAEESRFSFHRDEFEFTIPDVEIPDGTVAIDSGELRMDVEKLDVPRVEFRFFPELFGFPADYGDWTFTVEDIRIRDWRWRDDGYRVEQVEMYAEGARATASGRMSFPNDDLKPGEDARMRYAGSATVDIPYWSPLVQYFVRDTVHFSLQEANIAVEGSLEMIDGVFNAHADVLETSGLVFTDVRGSATLQNEYIFMKEGSADFHGGEIDVDWAYFNMLEVSYGGEGRFRGVDPASMLRDFEVDLPWLAGKVSGAIRAWGAVPMGQEWEFDTPMPVFEESRRELAEVEVTEPWRFVPAGGLPVPGGALTLAKGSEIRANYETVALSDATLRAGSDRVDIEHFELDYNTMVFEAPGEPEAVDLTATIEDIGPYARAAGLEGVGGRLEGALVANGAIDGPDMRFQARVDEPSFEVGERVLGGKEAVLRGRLQQGRLELEELKLDGQAGQLDASGSAQLWGGRGQIDGQYRVADLRLDVVDEVFGLGLGATGRMSAEGRFGGTVQQPRADFELSMQEGGVEGLNVASVTAAGSVGTREMELERASMQLAGAGSVSGSGRLGFADGRYRMKVAARQIELGALGWIEAMPAEYRPAGRLDARLHGEGSLEEPDLAGDIQVRELKAGQRELGSVALVADTLDGTVFVNGGVLPLASLRLEVPLSGDNWYNLRVGFDQQDVVRRLPELEQIGFLRSLLVTGTVNLDVARDFSDYMVTANLDDLRLETPDATFRTRGPVEAGLNSQGRVQIESLEIGSDGKFLNVRGGVVLGSWLTMLRVEGDLDLDLLDMVGRHVLTDVLPETLVDAEGVLNVDLLVRGPSGRPKPEGSVSFQQAKFVLRGFSDPLRIRQGTVQFGRDVIDVSEDNQLVGEFLGGVFSLSGQVGFEEYWPGRASLDLWSHNMMYRLPETANLTFDSDVNLRASSITEPETWDVSGRVDVLSALYYRDISLLEEQLAGRVLGAFSRQTERYEAGLLESYPWVGDIEFDVDLRARDGVRVENEIDRFGLEMEFRLDLQLAQTLRDPRLTGEIDVIDGTVEFQGEQFQVRRGTIEYTGSPNNPRVDIVAGADIRNRCVEQAAAQDFTDTFSFAGDFDETRREVYHVLLNVEGALENLDIQLESNPYADQRDILSLMLTGCTVDALTATSASQPTLEIALGPLLGRIEREVRDVVKLSEFTILPGVERTQVRIGDRLTRRLVWRFQLDTGLSERAGGQRYQLEYRLSDRWSAEVSERSHGETQNFLLDVKLKYRLPLD